MTGTYRCRSCRRRVPNVFGCADEWPYDCDDCWAVRDSLRRRHHGWIASTLPDTFHPSLDAAYAHAHLLAIAITVRNSPVIQTKLRRQPSRVPTRRRSSGRKRSPKAPPIHLGFSTDGVVHRACAPLLESRCTENRDAVTCFKCIATISIIDMGRTAAEWIRRRAATT